MKITKQSPANDIPLTNCHDGRKKSSGLTHKDESQKKQWVSKVLPRCASLHSNAQFSTCSGVCF